MFCARLVDERPFDVSDSVLLVLRVDGLESSNTQINVVFISARGARIGNSSNDGCAIVEVLNLDLLAAVLPVAVQRSVESDDFGRVWVFVTAVASVPVLREPCSSTLVLSSRGSLCAGAGGFRSR